MLEVEITEGSYVFAGTDNTSALDWTCKSIFSENTQQPHVMLARKLASLVMGNQFCLCSQHFEKYLNVVVDVLSRDFHLSDEFLTHLLFLFYPNHLPSYFKIYPLLTVIKSFITGILKASAGPQPVQTKRQASKT